jgi:hypothetical protein
LTNSTVENPGPIIGAGTRDITESALTMPNMRSAIINWFRPLQAILITTSIVDGESREVRRPFNTAGILLPMKARYIALKPEGQRAWRWFVLHVGREIELKPNDIIIRKNVPYRVMGRWGYEDYGWIRYELKEDFEHARAA